MYQLNRDEIVDLLKKALSRDIPNIDELVFYFFDDHDRRATNLSLIIGGKKVNSDFPES